MDVNVPKEQVVQDMIAGMELRFFMM